MKYNSFPKRRFKGFANAWEQRKLGNICEITMGQSPSSENYTSNPKDYILVQGNADIKQKRVVPRVWTTQITKLANRGDIILSVRAPVGDIGKTDYDVVLGRGVAAIKGNDFIYYSLEKKQVNHYWSCLSTGSTFDSINSNDIHNAEVHIPSNDEQRLIGDMFERLDNLITLHQRKLDKWMAIKDGLLQRMFPQNEQVEPELRLPGFSEPWKQCRLEDFIRVSGGFAWKSEEYLENGSFKVITIANVTGGIYVDDSIGHKIDCLPTNNFILENNDILVSLTGNVGRVSKMTSINAVLNQRVGKIIPRENLIASEFLFHILRNKHFENAMIDAGQGAAQKNISNYDIMNYSFFLPINIKEQKQIGIFFDKIDIQLTLHQRKLEKLKNLKQAYLNEMFV